MTIFIYFILFFGLHRLCLGVTPGCMLRNYSCLEGSYGMPGDQAMVRSGFALPLHHSSGPELMTLKEVLLRDQRLPGTPGLWSYKTCGIMCSGPGTWLLTRMFLAVAYKSRWNCSVCRWSQWPLRESIFLTCLVRCILLCIHLPFVWIVFMAVFRDAQGLILALSVLRDHTWRDHMWCWDRTQVCRMQKHLLCSTLAPSMCPLDSSGVSLRN